MVKLKTKEEIKILKEGGFILGNILDQLKKMVKPGLNIGDLEKKAIESIKEAGGQPSFKGYRAKHDKKPFPTALCASINEELVHVPALPNRYLKKGDIISLDIGMKYKNLYTDTAITVPVGNIGAQTEKLIRVTKECLDLAIQQVKPGNKLIDIARAVQINAEANGFGVVRELVGHGVGYEVHESPQVPNYDSGEDNIMGQEMETGLVIAIEPMLTIGDWRVKTGANGLSILTKDGSLCAHFEHTVAVTEDGCIIITAIE
ncbi:type I methionyl aminopeptidase [Candidatus Falkowbacteria bacterium CG10_big_fil_rev_8_21_14_0_10_43_10]|uniref:Methionine aminopeptidase n=1 Tax=Candidatus Falkowbacteria bacterium CG10_big_fil_rev_8_21_14_0_10_43_10 TaxID=1974567 RepID=A0A2H0V369_9BACT|nr:MAG: type I methionyl aminopeptidase [Candidatus Falkowbacteria bacterium CG10_big_fil_rev_8_21_14_0_10_43_10]